MSNLVDHAKRELDLLKGEDPALKDSILKAVEGFATYEGHSGGSHYVAVEMLNQLLEFRNLVPLTDDPDEWFFHGAEMSPPKGVWQNKRNGEAFSHDGGKTYYLLSDGGNEDSFKEGKAKMITSRPAGSKLVNAEGDHI